VLACVRAVWLPSGIGSKSALFFLWGATNFPSSLPPTPKPPIQLELGLSDISTYSLRNLENAWVPKPHGVSFTCGKLIPISSALLSRCTDPFLKSCCKDPWRTLKGPTHARAVSHMVAISQLFLIPLQPDQLSHSHGPNQMQPDDTFQFGHRQSDSARPSQTHPGFHSRPEPIRRSQTQQSQPDPSRPISANSDPLSEPGRSSQNQSNSYPARHSQIQPHLVNCSQPGSKSMRFCLT